MSPLAPEIILSVFTLAALFFSVAGPKRSAGLHPSALLLSGLAVGAGCLSLGASGEFFTGTYRIDGLSQIFKLLVSLGLFATVILSERARADEPDARSESFLFLGSGALGMTLMVSAADLVTLYLSLELSSYSLYLLAALRTGRRNPEAALKYLIFGAASSGILLWGLSVIAGSAGTLSLPAIAASSAALSTQPAFALGAALVVLAFLFKLSAFPMHFWAPDAYEAASTPVVHFIATASKAAGVGIFIRFLIWTGLSAPLALLLGVFSFASMTLGNTAALVQRDVKRLLAYSSVAQAGYLVLGLSSGSLDGHASAVFYAAAYLIMNAGAFLAVWHVASVCGKDNPSVEDFDGLAERAPFTALLLLVSLLSLAGIPPLAGFTGKWILFAAAMDRGLWFLVVWAVLNSVVSLFYYLTLVKHAYLKKPAVAGRLSLPPAAAVLGAAVFAALVLLGLFPDPLIRFAQAAVSSAGLSG